MEIQKSSNNNALIYVSITVLSISTLAMFLMTEAEIAAKHRHQQIKQWDFANGALEDQDHYWIISYIFSSNYRHLSSIQQNCNILLTDKEADKKTYIESIGKSHSLLKNKLWKNQDMVLQNLTSFATTKHSESVNYNNLAQTRAILAHSWSL